MKVDLTTVPLKQLRTFGLLMTGAFTIIGVWPWLVHGLGARMWALGVATVWALLAMVAPTALRPVYRGWMWIGEKVGWFNTRLLLGIIFFIIVTPFSFVMRMFGKRPLACRFDSERDSYRETKPAREPGHVLKPF